jgi:hypothetical protein
VDHITTRPPTPARALLQRHLVAADAPLVAAAALAGTDQAALAVIDHAMRGDDLVRRAEASRAALRVRHGEPTLVGGQVVMLPRPSEPELVALAEGIVRKLAATRVATAAPPAPPRAPHRGPVAQPLRNARPAPHGELYARAVETLLDRHLLPVVVQRLINTGYGIPMGDGTVLARDIGAGPPPWQ